MARSSSGQGHCPLKAEITGSNPVRATRFLVEVKPVLKSMTALLDPLVTAADAKLAVTIITITVVWSGI